MATFGDLQRYLERARGWEIEPSLTRGRRRSGDHVRYARVSPDGSRLRTRVSRHLREEIGEDLFRHILRDQLQVSVDEFWSVVRSDGAPAVAPGAAPDSPGLPGWLVVRLLEVAGIPEGDVLAMTPEAAQAAWDAYRSRPRE